MDASDVVDVVIDTAPPSAPFDVVGTPGNQKASLAWEALAECILGSNVYMATSSGGPYTKMNGDPVAPAKGRAWMQIGLTNGQPYYFVVTTVDMSQNESAFSEEVVIVPEP